MTEADMWEVGSEHPFVADEDFPGECGAVVETRETGARILCARPESSTIHREDDRD